MGPPLTSHIPSVSSEKPKSKVTIRWGAFQAHITSCIAGLWPRRWRWQKRRGNRGTLLGLWHPFQMAELHGLMGMILTTWFAARRWPWWFGGSIIVRHKMNRSILPSKTHVSYIVTSLHELRRSKTALVRIGKTTFLTTSKQSSKLLQEWMWIVTLSFMLAPHPW